MTQSPRYGANTIHMHIGMDGQDGSATVRLTSLHNPDGMPVWTKRGSDERDALLAELKHRFGGDAHVTMRRAEDSTDREIVIRPQGGVKPAEHLKAVEDALEGFAQRHEIELDMGDDTHKRSLVTGLAQAKLRDGIHRIVQDQLLDTEQKTDAIMELLKLRRDLRRGGGRE